MNYSGSAEEWVERAVKWMSVYYDTQDNKPEPPKDYRTAKSVATIEELKRRVGL
jgi:hypothetical protein